MKFSTTLLAVLVAFVLTVPAGLVRADVDIEGAALTAQASAAANVNEGGVVGAARRTAGSAGRFIQGLIPDSVRWAVSDFLFGAPANNSNKGGTGKPGGSTGSVGGKGGKGGATSGTGSAGKGGGKGVGGKPGGTGSAAGKGGSGGSGGGAGGSVPIKKEDDKKPTKPKGAAVYDSVVGFFTNIF